MENRFTQQLVPGHAGVKEGFASLEVKLVGAGDAIGGGPWVTAGLKGFRWDSRGETLQTDNTVGNCSDNISKLDRLMLYLNLMVLLFSAPKSYKKSQLVLIC